MAFGQPLDVWFVNVGHGDSTILRFPSGRVMMLDINNSRSLDEQTRAEILESAGVSELQFALGVVTEAQRRTLRSYEDLLDDPIDILKREVFQSDHGEVFRFIASHPDLDHLSGLYRLAYQESTIGMGNFWDTMNTKEMAGDDFKSDEDEQNWSAYQQLRRSKSDPCALFKYREQTGNYWTDDGISILSPTPAIVEEANGKSDWNHLSYVFAISYGSSRLILPADASIAAQEEMAARYGENLQSTILKAPHHGRKSGYCSDFTKYVSPDYTIVSVGRKPDTDATDNYRYHTQKRVLTTRSQGTIRARLYQDGSLELYNHKGQRLDQNEDLKKAAATSHRW